MVHPSDEFRPQRNELRRSNPKFLEDWSNGGEKMLLKKHGHVYFVPPVDGGYSRCKWVTKEAYDAAKEWSDEDEDEDEVKVEVKEPAPTPEPAPEASPSQASESSSDPLAYFDL